MIVSTTAALSVLLALASALPFTPGNIVVQRLNSTAVLTSAATQFFLDELTVTGSLVQTISIPVADSSGVFACSQSGSATSEVS